MPQPTNLKIARGGNPNSINMPQGTTEPLGKLPKAPAWLGPLGQERWAEIGPILMKAGVLGTRDLDAFACYCAAWHRWRVSEDVVVKHGPTVKGADGKTYRRPETSLARDALAQVLKYQEHFGMTPASRSRIDTPTGQAVDILTKLRTRREKARHVPQSPSGTS